MAATHASLQIAPTSLTLDGARSTGEVVMSSLDARTLIFDLETVAWKQNGDSDSFSPTSDLVVVPPVYDVAPYRQVLVRVGWTNKSESVDERAFQIRFREVQPPGATQTARTLEAPVFIAPSERRGEARYELQRTSPEEARLIVENASNTHVFLGDVKLTSGNETVFSGALRTYVLAGNTRNFTIRLARPVEGNEIELHNRADKEESTANVTVR
ncbi:MAG: fimbrial biogenesis chaperone [Vulcanimicrobiaceae bacterium]